MTFNNFKFYRDSSYFDLLTARAFGYAFVVYKDESGSWCAQVFDEDEDDEELYTYGEIVEEVSDFRSFGEAAAFCEKEAVRLHQYLR